jgi:pectate lyase
MDFSKGKGLRLLGSKNVIIQNIRITDLNAQYVWGGDAIGIDGGSNIWVSHPQLSPFSWLTKLAGMKTDRPQLRMDFSLFLRLLF